MTIKPSKATAIAENLRFLSSPSAPDDFPAPFITEGVEKYKSVCPSTIAESGLVVRVPYEGQPMGELFTLYFITQNVYSVQARFEEKGRCVDVVIPKSCLLEGLLPHGIGECAIYYFFQEPPNGKAMRSDVNAYYILSDLAPVSPLAVPQASGGVLYPGNVTAPGLKLEYPQVQFTFGWFFTARWRSYGRNGHLINELFFTILADGDHSYVPLELMALTEPGGEVHINYRAQNKDLYYVDSLHTVLRVSESLTLKAPVVVEGGKLQEGATPLYYCAIAETGAVMRIPVYEGMTVGQKITVGFRSQFHGSAEMVIVKDAGRYMDVILPRFEAAQHIDPDGGDTSCELYYEVIGDDGGSMNSPLTHYLMNGLLTPLPAMSVPQAADGKLYPGEIQEPGLDVIYDSRNNVQYIQWASYGVDGSLISWDRTKIPLTAEDRTYHIPLSLIAQTEAEGEVRINYLAPHPEDTSVLAESLHTVLRVMAPR